MVSISTRSQWVKAINYINCDFWRHQSQFHYRAVYTSLDTDMDLQDERVKMMLVRDNLEVGGETHDFIVHAHLCIYRYNC